MNYEEVRRVTTAYDGLPVDLKLQRRLTVPPHSFYCLSWRTPYPSGKSNRRFYRLTGSGFWTIPVGVALRLMVQARESGMLDARYDDRQVRHRGTEDTIIDSRALGERQRRNVFDAITSADKEPDWGGDPLFVIIEVPDGTWRKIMIVDTEREFCTFRSATTDVDYKPVITCLRSPWRMDNAMQDSSAAMMRKFLSTLEELCLGNTRCLRDSRLGL